MMSGLLIPTFALAVLGWVVPRLWSIIVPEGIPGLFAIATLSAFSLVTLAGLFFIVSYWRAGVTVDGLMDQGIIDSVAYFGRLGLRAAIIWAPMMALSLMALPRTWTRVTW